MIFFQEYRILTASGEIRWVNEQTFIHSDEKGDIEYLYGTVVDVTEKRQSSDFLRLRRDTGAALASTDELLEILRQLLDLALEVEPLDSGCIYLVDDDSGEMKIKTCRGLSPAFVKAASGFGKAQGLANLLRAGKPVYRQYFEIKKMISLETPPEEKLRAAAFLPIFSDGRFVAVMQLSSHKADEISETARKQLETIAIELGNEIGRIKEKAELRQISSDFQELFKSIKDFIFIVDHEAVSSIPTLLSASIFLIRKRNSLERISFPFTLITGSLKLQKVFLKSLKERPSCTVYPLLPGKGLRFSQRPDSVEDHGEGRKS